MYFSKALNLCVSSTKAVNESVHIKVFTMVFTSDENARRKNSYLSYFTNLPRDLPTVHRDTKFRAIGKLHAHIWACNKNQRSGIISEIEDMSEPLHLNPREETSTVSNVRTDHGCATSMVSEIGVDLSKNELNSFQSKQLEKTDSVIL
jgi:hypothetical protein